MGFYLAHDILKEIKTQPILEKINNSNNNVLTQHPKGQLQGQQRNRKKVHETTNHTHKHVNNNGTQK
jgi:hypothetical protein